MKLLSLLSLLLATPVITLSAAKKPTPQTSSQSADELLNLNAARAMDLLVYAPFPTYPYEARRAHIIGSGIARLTINTETGEVNHAAMQISTGSPMLDDATLNALRRWKFKPHTTDRAKVPITFTMLGVSFQYQKQERPLAEMLAPYLGAGAIRKAKVPEYPDREHWTFKHGKGRYELHIDSTGRVESVMVLQSSGDPIFDKAAQKTLRKWELNRGPLVVELPLSFILTPNSYRVDVAR